MNNEYPHIEELIAKQLAGETSVAEEQLLSEWLKASEQNQEYYNSLQKIYDETAALKELKHVDTDAAWNKLKEKIKLQEQGKPGGKIRSLNINYFLRIAAVLILVAGAAIILYTKLNTTDKPVMVATTDHTQEIKLPDSSVVFLNKNSSITYTYSDKQREIALSGEAYFEVIHNTSQPFTVRVGNLEIKDIGTSFNINARSLDSVEVQVQSGEVSLHAGGTDAINISQGEGSVYRKTTNTITKISISDPNTLAYKTKIFVFENASLPSVIQKLNEVYGTQIKFADNLCFCHFTSTFKNEKIESILQIIAETLQLHINRDHSQIVLEGTSCEE